MYWYFNQFVCIKEINKNVSDRFGHVYSDISCHICSHHQPLWHWGKNRPLPQNHGGTEIDQTKTINPLIISRQRINEELYHLIHISLGMGVMHWCPHPLKQHVWSYLHGLSSSQSSLHGPFLRIGHLWNAVRKERKFWFLNVDSFFFNTTF